MRYELTNHEWAAIKPMLPNKPRGVPRVCRSSLAPIPLAIIDSFVGVGLVCGAVS